MSDQPIESVEADTILGKYKVTGANVNTLVTILGFVLICVIAWTLYVHTADAKDGDKETAKALRESNAEVAKALRESNADVAKAQRDSHKEISEVMKEMSRATREQNCLLSLPPDQRARNVETCKRLAQ